MNITLNANAGFFMGRDFDLEAGVLDDDARHVFKNGHCHSLALAIHEETGWGIVGTAYGDEDEPGHVGIRVPDGRILDIDGLHTEHAWASSYFSGDVLPVNPDDACDAFDGAYREPDVEAARHWVEPVLGLLSNELANVV